MSFSFGGVEIVEIVMIFPVKSASLVRIGNFTG